MGTVLLSEKSVTKTVHLVRNIVLLKIIKGKEVTSHCRNLFFRYKTNETRMVSRGNPYHLYGKGKDRKKYNNNIFW